MGLAMPLGSHLSEKLKEGIWKHEFVDVFKLLHREVQAKEGSKEEEWELTRRPRVPVTMENWTSAFLIFASVYCQRYLDRAIALFKYMDIIRKAQMQFGGFAWLSYDEEFRARVSANPEKSWGEVDQELWVQWMALTHSTASTHTASGLPVVYRSFPPRPAQGCVGGPGSKTVTWIVGHSFVHWASKYAERQIYGRNLGLKGHLHEVQWWGKGGMRWGALLPWLAKMLPQRGCPDLLIIHLGENDLVQLSGLALLQLMQRDLDVLKGRLAGTCIAWTELVPRKVWRGAMKHGAIEKARRKLNRAMRLYCGDNDIKVIAHEGIRLAEPLVFRDDGVHLSQLGNAYYMMEMRDVVSKLWNEAIWCPRV
ncbi:uncharacterized protein LOC144756516 [Lissotriton helveticus]